MVKALMDRRWWWNDCPRCGRLVVIPVNRGQACFRCNPQGSAARASLADWLGVYQGAVQAAVAAAVEGLDELEPAERAAAAYRLRRELGEDGQAAADAAYAAALGALVAVTPTYAVAAAALAELGEQLGDADLAAVNSKAIRQRLKRPAVRYRARRCGSRVVTGPQGAGQSNSD